MNVIFEFFELMFFVFKWLLVISFFFFIILIFSLLFIDNLGVLLFIGKIIIGMVWVMLNLLLVRINLKEFLSDLELLCLYIIVEDFVMLVLLKFDIGKMFVMVFCCIIWLWCGGFEMI